MKRFRSVGSDRCSMLLTDFKAGAKFCDKTAMYFSEGSIAEERRNLQSHEVDNSDLRFLHRV